MAFTLIQAGTSLVSLNGSGGAATLTLPTNITLSSNRVPRFARFNRYVVLVNSPSRPLSIGVDGVVRPLVPLVPASKLTLAGAAGGALTGTFRALQTYLIRDALGNTIAQSDFGPVMDAAVTISGQYLRATGINLSVDPSVTATQLWRTSDNGATYFPWVIIDGNTNVAYQDGKSDAALGLIAAPNLGSAPDLTLICEWGGRLWGVDRLDIDNARFTEPGTMYGWNAENAIPIPHIGSDDYGITAIIPRRSALGFARKETFVQVTGTDLSNYAVEVIGEGIGCESQESVMVFRDAAYFLWRDGVYRWDSTGINSMVDGRVRSWFTTGDVFNKAMFPRAFAVLDPDQLTYRLYLASAGSTIIDRWIELDLETGAWWGPHKTDAFQPTCALSVIGNNGYPFAMVGSAQGYVSQETDTKADWSLFPITMHVETKPFAGEDPNVEQYWGQMTINGRAQSAGTLAITPAVGELGASSQAPFNWDMTRSSQRLARLGVGKHASLKFDHSTINEDVVIYGFEIPVNSVGRR